MIDDTAIFFDNKYFGEPATLNGQSTNVIFEVKFEKYMDGYAVVSSHTPTVYCPSASVLSANVEQDSQVIVRSKTYLVSDIQDDGTGVTVLILREA